MSTFNKNFTDVLNNNFAGLFSLKRGVVSVLYQEFCILYHAVH